MIRQAIHTNLAGLLLPVLVVFCTLFSYANLPSFHRISDEGHFPTELIPSDYIIVKQIELEGNIETRKHIILREIPFAIGDTISKADLQSRLNVSRENLLNTSLFNFVDVAVGVEDIIPYATVRFSFVERWYIWPFPIVELSERNINEWLESPSLHKANYGVFVVKENFRGRMEKISILARAGYRQVYNFGYSIPYINKGQKLGLSFNVGYNRRNEIEYMTLNNEQLFYLQPQGFALQHFSANAQLHYRQGFFNRHKISVEFNQTWFADSILLLNPLFSKGAETRARYLTLGYEFKKDHRDVRAYPLTGYYFDFKARKYGMGLLTNEQIDITSFESSGRKFINLAHRWHYAVGINAKYSFGNFIPYYLQQGLGFRGDLVRGYENFVIDGQSFLILKNNLKYTLIPTKSAKIGFIPNEKFSLIHYALFVNLFADAGYVNDNLFFTNNPYSNKLLASTGIGFDLVTYYDKVFRTEFAITRQGDFGVYFHLIAPI